MSTIRRALEDAVRTYNAAQKSSNPQGGCLKKAINFIGSFWTSAPPESIKFARKLLEGSRSSLSPSYQVKEITIADEARLCARFLNDLQKPNKSLTSCFNNIIRNGLIFPSTHNMGEQTSLCQNMTASIINILQCLNKNGLLNPDQNLRDNDTNFATLKNILSQLLQQKTTHQPILSTLETYITHTTPQSAALTQTRLTEILNTPIQQFIEHSKLSQSELIETLNEKDPAPQSPQVKP